MRCASYEWKFKILQRELNYHINYWFCPYLEYLDDWPLIGRWNLEFKLCERCDTERYVWDPNEIIILLYIIPHHHWLFHLMVAHQTARMKHLNWIQKIWNGLLYKIWNLKGAQSSQGNLIEIQKQVKLSNSPIITYSVSYAIHQHYNSISSDFSKIK